MTTAIRNRPFNSTNVRMSTIRSRGTHTFLRTLGRVAPGYTEKLINTVFFAPARPPLTDTQRKMLSQGQEYEWRMNGKTIKYWRWGQGPPILLAHGWNGRGISLFRFIGPLVENGHTVIAFDAPAHGESEGATTSYFELTNVVRAIIDPNRGVAFRGIIAHSFGAAATVNALFREQLPLPTVLIAPALDLKKILYNTFDGYGIPQQLYRKIIAGYEHTYGYSLERDNPLRLLPNIIGPMLVIHDRNDDVIPHADSRAAVDNLDTAHLHTTSGLGHKRVLLDETVINLSLTHLQNHSDALRQQPASLPISKRKDHAI